MKQPAGYLLVFLLCFSSLLVKAQMLGSDFQLPLRIAPVLSANFGELRNDHFHSGLDFKTQGVIGKSIHSIAEGHVARISVRKYGYGKALYIDHPNGYTSVYAHLEYLSPRLDSVLKAAQYKAQSYFVDLSFNANELPVFQGELIAYSGNTGGSGGPHLHFEIRDTKTEDIIDPLLWYAPYIKDKVKPRIHALAIYHYDQQNHDLHLRKKDILAVDNNIIHSALPKVWGDIALGVKAYDYMSDTHNIYGVRLVRLFLEDKEIFRQEINRFSFAKTRYINYVTDYEEWALHRQWIMRSFFPHNRQGLVHIDEEKDYHFRYELSDRHGNVCIFPFVLRGEKPQAESAAQATNEKQADGKRPRRLHPAYQNDLLYQECILQIAPGTLYESVDFHYEVEQRAGFSPVYHVGSAGIALHKKAKLSVLVKNDLLENPQAYYLAWRNHKNEWEYVESRYEKGWMHAQVNKLGDYTVLADTISPKISLTNIDNHLKNDLIRIRVSDKESDIAKYQVYIDGKWALFEDDYKRDAIFYRIDGIALQRSGQEHQLKVLVWDACGNGAQAETLFIY